MPPADATALHQLINRAVKEVRTGQIADDFDELACRSALIQLARPLLDQPFDPLAAAHLNAIGLRAAELLQYDLAIQLFTAAIDGAPANADYHLHLASAHRFAGDLPAAVDHYRAAVQLRPEWPKALVNLAEALDLAGSGDEAIAYFQELRRITGDEVNWLINLGSVELHRRRVEPAIAAFRHAIALDPGNAVANYKLGWTLLSDGQFEEGWRYYEWRTPADQQARRRARFNSPQWCGENLAGKTLLLEAEQGLGDMLHFIRFTQTLADGGAKVVVECAMPLRRLMAMAPGVSATTPIDRPPPPHDFHILPMSLPLRLGTDLASIPSRVPYLRPPPADAAAWGDRLAENARMPDRPFRVGLAWAGNRLNRNDSRRSCPPQLFDALPVSHHITYYSLQKRQPFHVPRPARLPLLDHTALLGDLADTAALVEHLDLVICVDTAIAHLAGALGKAVWILLPYFADWRWLCDRADSPWYPTARLFRQPAPGDWQSAMRSVGLALEEILCGQAPGVQCR